jgi:hypothetical protein
MTDLSLQSRLDSLIALSEETEWAEFKHNNTDPEIIGEYPKPHDPDNRSRKHAKYLPFWA